MGFQPWQVVIILVIVLILFGPKQLPKLMQSVGQSVRELKKGLAGINEDLDVSDKESERKSGEGSGGTASAKTQSSASRESEAEPVERKE